MACTNVSEMVQIKDPLLPVESVAHCVAAAGFISQSVVLNMTDANIIIDEMFVQFNT